MFDVCSLCLICAINSYSGVAEWLIPFLRIHYKDFKLCLMDKIYLYLFFVRLGSDSNKFENFIFEFDPMI